MDFTIAVRASLLALALAVAAPAIDLRSAAPERLASPASAISVLAAEGGAKAGRGQGGDAQGKRDERKNKKKRNRDRTCFGKQATIRANGPTEGTPGNDVVIAGPNGIDLEGSDGTDRVCGGPADDEVDYSDVAADALFARGGAGNDELIANDAFRAELFGEAGDDTVFGGAGSDLLDGGPGDDIILSGDGSDIFRGGDGDDSLGAVTLSRNPGRDLLDAGPGDDSVRTTDNLTDLVDCGPGVDTVFFDEGLDVIKNCEILNPPN